MLGSLLGPRTAIGLAGVLLLATPLLFPRRAAATAVIATTGDASAPGDPAGAL